MKAPQHPKTGGRACPKCGGTFVPINQNNLQKEDIKESSQYNKTNKIYIDIYEAVKKGNIEEIKTYIKNGGDINTKMDCHWEQPYTPLMYATRIGNYELVKFLIEAGADVNVKNESGFTALFIAADFGKIEIIKLLRNAGADHFDHTGLPKYLKDKGIE
jgi:ankyrin repeat protein